MSELKKCPFCGSEPTASDEFDDEVLFYGCTKDIDCPLYDAPFVNMANWNSRPIEDALNARIAELEAVIEILEDQQRDAKNILIDKNLHIDSLYEEGYKLQQRIADLEFELSAMKDAGDVMHERLATLSTFGVRTPDGVKEAMSYWANSVQAGDVNG